MIDRTLFNCWVGEDEIWAKSGMKRLKTLHKPSKGVSFMGLIEGLSTGMETVVYDEKIKF